MTATLDDRMIATISDAFVAARHSATPLADYPGERPSDLASAYAIQNRSIAQFGKPVVAWKVGGIPPHHQSAYGASRLAGPVFEGMVQHVEDGGEVTVPVFGDGFAAVEPEYVVRYDTLPDHDVTPEQAREMVSALYIGIEIASSPLPTINDLGPGVTISDFGNNGGLIVGPEIPKDTDVSAHEVNTVIDGEEVGRCPAAADGPWQAASFLLNHLRAHDITPSGPIWITTGAITGVHSAPFTSRSVVTFDGLGTMTVSLTPYARS